ncbi:hypothetical protein HY251_15330 [bacterium]|nr:hypothetical protein [bacterium]
MAKVGGVVALEDVIAPGEKLASVVPWRGYHPVARMLALVLLALGLALAQLVIAVREEMARGTDHTWSLGIFFVRVVTWTGSPPPEELAELIRKVEGSLSSYGGSAGSGRTSWSYHGGAFLTPAWLLLLIVVAEIWRVLLWRSRRAGVTDARIVALDPAGRWIGQLPRSEGRVEDDARRLLRTRVGHIHMPEIEEVLAPGETVAWEGRPGAFVLPVLRLLAYLGILLLDTGVIAFDLHRTATGGGAPSVLVDGRDPRQEGTATHSFEIGLGTVSATRTTTGAGLGASTYGSTWPSPVAFLPLFFAIELCVLAAFRARRYGITSLRVLALGWRGRWLGQVARPAESVRIEGRTLVVVGGGREVRFEALDDPAAARSALEGGPNPRAGLAPGTAPDAPPLT